MDFADFFSSRASSTGPLLILAGVAALLTGTEASAAEGKLGAEVKVLKNLPYYEGAGADKERHKLDLFLPEGKKDFPMLLFVHGGAWMHGDKEFLGVYQALGKAVAKQGIGVAVINYRLSPAVKHPEHVKDVARAVAWTVKNAARHGGKADRLFLCGHSAGGHLVALLTADETYLKNEGLSTKNVRGVIPVSGVYQIPDRIFPAVFGPDGAGRRAASPLTHVRAGLPPILLLCAEKDLPGCGKEPAERFCKALTGKGNKAEVREFAGLDHYTIVAGAMMPDSPVHQAIVDFVRTHSAEKK